MDVYGFDVPVWLLLIVVIVILVYIHGTWTYTKFQEIGLPGPRPYPYIGNMVAVMSKGFRDYDREMAEKYGGVVGIYEGRQPSLLISDASLLRQIFVKDFNTFVNKRAIEFFDPPFDKMMVVLENDAWKRVRNLVTPAFTSGKLKKMLPGINTCAQWLVEYIESHVTKNEPVDIKRGGEAFSMDVVAGTGFGIETNCLKNPDDKFLGHVHKMFAPRAVSLLIVFLIPKWLRKMLNLTYFPKDSVSFFSSVLDPLLNTETDGSNSNLMETLKNAHVEDFQPDEKDAAQDREYGVEYEHNKHFKKALTKDEMRAQALIFFSAGSETTGSTITFFCYLMATHQDIQDKVMAEIDQVVGEEVNVTVDMLEKMTYLDQCINECLRIYPPIGRNERVPNRDVDIGGYRIAKGTICNISVFAIHLNKDYWPEPEKFDPDRFSPENNDKIEPMTFIPFGYGPRNCVGMRMALMETRIALIRIFQNFRLKTCDKTPEPLELIKIGVLKPTGDVWLRAESRVK